MSRIPSFLNLSNRMVWSILSNALDRSMKMSIGTSFYLFGQKKSPHASLQNLRVNGVFLNLKTKNSPCFSPTKEYVKHFQMLQHCVLRRA